MKNPAFAGLFICLLTLDDAGFLEGLERSVLLDVAEAVYRDVDENGLIELRDENPALLEVCLAAYLSGWVELGSTGTVGVPSAYLRAFSSDFTASSHSPRMLA